MDRNQYSFETVFQFLAYYREGNPARTLYYEKDRFQPHRGRLLDGREATSWELCCILLDRALSTYEKTSMYRRCFEWRYLVRRGDRDERLSTEDIASRLGHHPSTIRRWIADVRDHLERVLIDAEVIPPREDA